MDFGTDVLVVVLRESVSLAVLLVVLFGLYKLTNKFLTVFLELVKKCCFSLERIADALGEHKKE